MMYAMHWLCLHVRQGHVKREGKPALGREQAACSTSASAWLAADQPVPQLAGGDAGRCRLGAGTAGQPRVLERPEITLGTQQASGSSISSHGAQHGTDARHPCV